MVHGDYSLLMCDLKVQVTMVLGDLYFQVTHQQGVYEFSLSAANMESKFTNAQDTLESI